MVSASNPDSSCRWGCLAGGDEGLAGGDEGLAGGDEGLAGGDVLQVGMRKGGGSLGASLVSSDVESILSNHFSSYGLELLLAEDPQFTAMILALPSLLPKLAVKISKLAVKIPKLAVKIRSLGGDLGKVQRLSLELLATISRVATWSSQE